MTQNGVSREVPIDWYPASGLSGTQNANHYRDYDGHGTHVGGTAVGLTFGWEEMLRIRCLNGLEGTGDSGTGISADCFDVIKLWHRKKPVDPNKSAKIPTIINASWGYSIAPGLNSVTYRGSFIILAMMVVRVTSSIHI